MSVSLEPPHSDAPLRGPRPWYLRPYLHVVLSVVFSTAAQPLLKVGADAKVEHGVLLGFTGLLSGWVWLGIAAMIASLFCWLYAIRYVPLNIAFNFSGISYVLVPIESWLFLGDKIGPQRWLGIALVAVGVVITAREAVRLEDKL